jgi:predicted GNAT family acetyltransferase
MPQHPLDISHEAVTAKIINFTAFKNAGSNNVLMPFPSRLARNQLSQDQVKYKTKYSLQDSEKTLRAEVIALQQELAIVQQEKAALESLLKQQEETRKLQLQEMQIEIDLHKVAHQVAEITQTDYFQQLQIEIASLRNTKIS